MALENNISEFIAQYAIGDTVSKEIAAGVLGGAIIGVVLILLLVFLVALYVYTSLAWYTVAKKLKNKNAWLAWIPIVNIALILQLGEFHWAWIFLILIPILGWIALFIICIVAKWKIFEKRKYPGWFSLSVIIPKVGGILTLIALGFLAWGNNKKSKKR